MKWNEDILRNLEDAGCGPELFSQYGKLAEQSIWELAVRGQQTQLLRGYRKDLMKCLYEVQRRGTAWITCCISCGAKHKESEENQPWNGSSFQNNSMTKSGLCIILSTAM